MTRERAVVAASAGAPRARAAFHAPDALLPRPEFVLESMAEHRNPSATTAAAPDMQALRNECSRLRQTVEGLTEIVSMDVPTDELLERVLGFVMEVTGAAGAAFELVEGDALEYLATAGSAAPLEGMRLPIDASLSGLGIRERELQYSADARADPRVHPAACARVDARSLLAMPLFHFGEPIGVLKVISPEPGAFDGIDRHALRLSAGLMGHAIGRQRLLDEKRQLLGERTAALSRASTVLAASPTPTVVHDLEGVVYMWNPAAEELLGWTADEVIGRPMPVAVSGAELFRAITARIVREGTAASEIVRRRRKDGSLVHVRVSGAPVHDEDGEVVGVVRTLEDVTDFHAHAGSLKAAAERVRNIVELSHDAFVSMDATGRVIEWNGAAEKLFGWSRQEALLRPLEMLVIPEEARPAHRAGVQRFLASGQSELIGRRIDVMASRKDGSKLPVELSISAAEVDGRPVFDAFLADISERRSELDELREQVLLDMLTRLPGRDYFMGQLRAALERNREVLGRTAVLLINLDDFRAINDLYGHASGDALLQEVAVRLKAAVRDNDIVARLGGDDFAIVLKGLRDAHGDARAVARKVLAAFEEPVRLRGSPLPVQASLGIALHEYARDDVESLMHRAHEAMCAAKRAGGQRFEMFAGNAKSTGGA